MNRKILASNKIWNQYDYNHLQDLTKAKCDMKYWKGMGLTVVVDLVLLAVFKMAPIIRRQAPLTQIGRTGHLRNNNHTHRRRTPSASPEQHPPYRRWLPINTTRNVNSAR